MRLDSSVEPAAGLRLAVTQFPIAGAQALKITAVGYLMSEHALITLTTVVAWTQRFGCSPGWLRVCLDNEDP